MRGQTFRALARNRGFSLACILTLALGIGANTAIFSWVNAVLLRPLPFKDPDRLVWLWSRAWDRERGVFSIPDFLDYQAETKSLDSMTVFTNWGANLTDQAEPERLQGLRMLGNAFQVLGVNATVGRALMPSDDNPNSVPVVVLSNGLWRRRFGGDPQLIGRTLSLNGEAYTVVGVLPPDFVFPVAEAELAIPLALDRDPKKADRSEHFLRGIARLKPGVTASQVQAEMNTICEHLRRQYPSTNAKIVGVKAVPLQEELTGSFRLALQILLGAVALVLMIACANLANLLLVRASARRKEFALRVALGSSRARIVRLLLGEGLTLALLGGLLSLAIAPAGLRLILAQSPAELTNRGDIVIDARVLGFALGISVLAGLVIGVIPAFTTPKLDPAGALNEGGRSWSETRTGRRTRATLVVVEVALSVVLLVAAGLLVKSLARLQQVWTGFEASRVLTVRLSLPRVRYATPRMLGPFQDRLLGRIQQSPGVGSAAFISMLPLSGLNPTIEFTVVGQPPKSMAELPAAQYRMITPSYFRTMGIPFVQGREFTDEDAGDSHYVAIINQTMARRYWPYSSAVGAHLRLDDADHPQRDVEIVGVVGDVRHISLDGEPTTDVYVPYRQIPDARMTWATNNMYLVVRTSTNPLSFASAVRRELRAIDSEVPAAYSRSMDQYIAASVAPRRFNVLVLGIFAVTALLLAATGIYGVISYTVTQQTHDIGVRIALGAGRGNIVWLIVSHALGLTLIGETVGILGAFGVRRILSGILFSVGYADPTIFLVVLLVLTLAAIASSYLPAMRAAATDPLASIRSQ
jgi:putative ABC transport system permease protein